MRPLIMHSIHRRLGLGAVARATQAETMAASGVHQLGVGARDGCVKAYHATAALVELSPDKPIMGLDVSAAHQSLDRAWMMQEVRDLCPVLERPLAVWYPRDEPTTHWWRTSDGKVVDVPAGNGLDQGCPLACPTYGVFTARLAERALEEVMRTKDSKAQLLLFADDTQLQTDADNLTHAHNAVSAEWARAGLRLNIGKTRVFAPDPDFPLGDWGLCRVSVLKCLGADLTDDSVAWEHPTQGGTPNDELARSAIKLTAYASRLLGLEDSGLSTQLAQPLLRYAMVDGPQHILMCKLVSLEQAAVHDAAVRRAWQLVVGVGMTDDNWERATYPLKQGGLAPGTVGTRASAAYLVALTRTMPEVLRWTAYDGALRRAAPALDRGITVATADLRNRGVPTEKVPFANGNGTVEPKQKDIVAVINDTRYGDRLATLDEDGRGQLGRPLGLARRPSF